MYNTHTHYRALVSLPEKLIPDQTCYLASTMDLSTGSIHTPYGFPLSNRFDENGKDKALQLDVGVVSANQSHEVACWRWIAEILLVVQGIGGS
jgi:hypothetical protein